MTKIEVFEFIQRLHQSKICSEEIISVETEYPEPIMVSTVDGRPTQVIITIRMK